MKFAMMKEVARRSGLNVVTVEALLNAGYSYVETIRNEALLRIGRWMT